MRQMFVLSAGLTLMAASVASAGIPWYSNAPRPPLAGQQDGAFSDAFSSGGNYYYSFALGQRMTVGSDRTLGSVRLWGASEYVESGIPPAQQTRLSTNILAIQLTFFEFGPAGPSSVPRYEVEIGIDRFTQTATGNSVPGIFSPVFELRAALSHLMSIAPGDYLISAGAVLAAPEGSAFAWMQGVADGLALPTRAYGTNGDQVGTWGQWAPLVTNTTGAIELYSEIPGPASISLLALGGLARSRRRH